MLLTEEEDSRHARARVQPEGRVTSTSERNQLENIHPLQLRTLIFSVCLFTIGLGFHFAVANQSYFVSKQTGIPFRETVLAIEMADFSAPFVFFATPWLIKFPVNKVMGFAMAISGLISFFSAIGTSPDILVIQLAITRFIYGFCVRMTAAWIPASINKFMDEDLRTTAISINQAAFSLKILMFMVTGLLLKKWGWQAMFLAIGVLQIPIGAIFYFTMPTQSLQNPITETENDGETQSLLQQDHDREQRESAWQQLKATLSNRYVLAISFCGFVAGFIQVATYVLIGVWLPVQFGLDSFEVGMATMGVTVGSLIGLISVVYLDQIVPPKIATVYAYVLFVGTMLSMILVESIGQMTLALAIVYVGVLGFTWAIFFSRGIFVAVEFAAEDAVTSSISFFKISSPLGAFVGGSVVPVLWLAGGVYGVVGGMATLSTCALITTTAYNLFPPERV